MKRLGFVTPWYGENIPGGAEMELRGLVKHLHGAGIDVEILTTCVKQFTSDWNVNYYKEGADNVNGIRVIRFPVRKRDVVAFDAVNYKLMNNMPISEEEEEIYVREMINSPALYKYMDEHKMEYSLYVFIPYMFGTTFWGAQVCPEKSVLIPCLHDESYAYMQCFKNIFQKVGGMIFHAKPESELANSIYDLSAVPNAILGEGVYTEIMSDAHSFRNKFKIDSPFILYAGRKDKGKNVDTLVKYFGEYKRRNSSGLKLVLIGGGKIDIPKEYKHEIIDLGFVDLQDKYDACAAAEFLCQPSKNESFSLVIMESWLCSRPVLVHEDCAVTKNFAIESKGGLYFKDYYDFEGCLNFYLEHKDIATEMGKNGRAYVIENFAWDVIVDKYTKFFEQCEKN